MQVFGFHGAKLVAHDNRIERNGNEAAMSKSIDIGSFDDELGKLIEEGVSEILAEGLDAECPACGKAFALDFGDPKCPFCGAVVNVEC